MRRATGAIWRTPVSGWRGQRYADDHERLDNAQQLVTIAIGHALTALAMALVPWCSPEIALGEDRVEDDGS